MSLVGMSVYRLFRCRFSFGIAGILSSIVVLLFGLMVGFGISVKRALCMLIVQIGADISGRHYDSGIAMALSIFFVLCSNPYGIFSISFLLSYSAVLSVAVLVPVMENWLWDKQKGKRWQKTLLANGAIWVFQLPVITAVFFQVPIYSVILNLVVVPLVSVVLVSGIISALLTFVWSDLAIFVCGSGVYVLKLFYGLCLGMEEMPGAYIVTGIPDTYRYGMFFCSLIILFGMIYLKSLKNAAVRYKFLVLIVCFGIMTGSMLISKQPDGLKVSILDVGQGDCTLIQCADGSNVLVDGGSTSVSEVGKYRIVPCLKAKGVNCIDVAMISHGDEDHISGIEEILKENMIDVKCILLPDVPEYVSEYEMLVEFAKKRGTQVRYVGRNQQIKQGNLTWKVLHPDLDGGSNINDSSLVLEMKYRDYSMCFTGDISSEVEKELIEIWQRTDVLKVAHHGSKYSSSDVFLEKISPSYATISCGEDNRYGHPHVETLNRLEKTGSTVLVTKDTGEIVFEVDESGNIISVERMH